MCVGAARQGDDRLMSAYNGSKFDERAAASAAARKAALEKFQARPKPDDPAVLERMAKQREIAEARKVRAAERQAAKEAEAARKLLEDQEYQAKLAAEAAEREAQAEAERLRVEAAKAAAKAARDARYAARKARR